MFLSKSIYSAYVSSLGIKPMISVFLESYSASWAIRIKKLLSLLGEKMWNVPIAAHTCYIISNADSRESDDDKVNGF